MPKVAFALMAHPDDIEIQAGGTLLLLKKAGWELHYMNLANGCCGTEEYGYRDIVRIRRKEGMAAAKELGAKYHESLTDDMQVFYEDNLIRRVAAIIRKVAPDIMFIHSLEDYMEDHMNSARVAVSAAFCRAMTNYRTEPRVPIIQKDVTLYHAMPAGLTGPMRNPIVPEIYVNIESVLKDKLSLLRHHQTQKVWLDKTQGMDSWKQSVNLLSGTLGKMSKKFKYAEGWRRHSHVGYSDQNADPLSDSLKKFVLK